MTSAPTHSRTPDTARSRHLRRKTLFDAMRRILGRGFRQSEVEQLDRAIDEAAGISPQDRVPSVPSCRIGPDGIALIQRFEGCARLRPDGMVESYPDPATGGAPWTIGWGATRGFDGEAIRPGVVWSRAQCDRKLEIDLELYAADVARALGDAPASQQQFDALVSFHYNTGAIARATLTKRHCAGDFAGAANEFSRWNRAGGRVLRGLTRRRDAEAALYRRGS